MCAGDFAEHPGGVGAYTARVVVDERALGGERCLLQQCLRPCEPKGPVVL